MAGLTPPARSWFRLASIARMEGAEAAAAAATARGTTTPTTPLPPRAPIPRPQQQPTLPPPQPPIPPPQTPTLQPPPPLSPTPQAEPQPKLPVAPTPQPEIQTQAPAATEAAVPPPSPNGPQQPSTPPRAATPPESPKVIMPSYSSPPPSPKAKQTNATPIQPPPNPEPEPEPETMPLPPPQPQSFSAAPEEKSIINGNGRSRVNNVSHHKLQAKEEKQLRVITMAGENTGAVMDIGSAASRRLGHHIHHAEGNGRGGKMEQEHADSKKGGKTAPKTKHMEAVVNSNVQGINNSIVLNSSTTQHSPGVHITFASNRKAQGSATSSSHKEHDSDHLH